jgi:electron transfer flavoprotein alpha subunit
MIETRCYVIALHDNGRVAEETYETAAFARRYVAADPCVVVLSGGGEIEPLAGRLADRTGLTVIGLAGDIVREYCAEAYTASLISFLREKGNAFVCIPHTARGIDFAPQLSVGIGACCITAVEGAGEGTFIRSVYSGRFRSEVRPETPSAVLTVMPGAFKPEKGAMQGPGSVKIVPLRAFELSTKTRGTREAVHANMTLSRAEVVVSAGRGLGSAENLRLVEMLSGIFPKSAIGATRGVCDLGWLDYSHQIGTTGNTVAPRLYLACGISGAVQHVSGMKNSQLIVAINTDPDASIFRTAHFGIVEDLKVFIPLLVDMYREKHGDGDA